MADETTFVPKKHRTHKHTTRFLLRIVFHRLRSRIGECIPLSAEATRIGRDLSTFPGGPLLDRKISRQHAAFSAGGGGVTLHDLESSNGTFVNGLAIREQAIAVGDIVRIGDTFFSIAPETDDASVSSDVVIGFSPSMLAVRNDLAKAAMVDSTVLFIGETGTGKDLAARELHQLSGRSGQYVAVNCSAVPENLLESELFGHMKGAFSGAEKAKRGLFEVADRGTLFLDEIGEMNPGMQAKLLRVLQDKEIRPLGGTQSRHVDARVVAATNVNLIEAVNEKVFRADLYSRLSQWIIAMPPLRDRREDIPALMLNALPRNDTRNFSPELVETFLRHNWPFNVRELSGFVEQSLVDTDDDPIALTPRVEQLLEQNRKIRIHGGDTPASMETQRQPESREAMETLLRKHNGNINQIATQLGKHRYQVYRWLKSHDLDPADFRTDTHEPEP